ncbi:MAG: CYTH domain-containing protein [Firmicutes bacterium]|nr:CYTH domain-containing protein [Bacillota bacterium]
MEIELKYLVKDEFVRDKILSDKHLEAMMQKDSYEEIEMKALYLDTEELDFLKEKIAFRIRMENGRPVATLKWGGGNEGALHARGELNVVVDEKYIKDPDVEIFKGSEMYDKLKALSAHKSLIGLMSTNCIRKQIMVDTGRSISVISLDVGEITTDFGSAPISELEVELYSGDEQDMIALGEELAAKYNLEAGVKSKFRVGLDLLGLSES